MTAIAVTDEAAVVGHAPMLVQNLGPDNLYIDVNTVSSDPPTGFSTDTAVRLGAGASVSISNEADYIWALSEGDSDVRLLAGGNAISDVDLSA